MSNLDEKLLDFEKAITNLKSITLLLKTDDIHRDATIKRFEICYDLSWKCLKHKLLTYGVEVYNPRNTFTEGVKANIISDMDKWAELIEMRNIAVHSYDSLLAAELHTKIPTHLELFEQLYSALNTK